MSNTIGYSIGSCSAGERFDFSRSAVGDVTGNGLSYSIGLVKPFSNDSVSASCPDPIYWGIHSLEDDPVGGFSDLSTGSGQWPYLASEGNVTVPAGIFFSCVSKDDANSAALAYAQGNLQCESELSYLEVFNDSKVYLVDNIESYDVGSIALLNGGNGWYTSGEII